MIYGVIPQSFGTYVAVDADIGVLASGMELDMRNGVLNFPVENHLTYSFPRDSLNNPPGWKQAEGPISVTPDDFVYLGQEVKSWPVSSPTGRTILRQGLLVLLGDGVDRYFNNHYHQDKTYKGGLDELHRLIAAEAPAK